MTIEDEISNSGVLSIYTSFEIGGIVITSHDDDKPAVEPESQIQEASLFENLFSTTWNYFTSMFFDVVDFFANQPPEGWLFIIIVTIILAFLLYKEVYIPLTL